MNTSLTKSVLLYHLLPMTNGIAQVWLPQRFHFFSSSKCQSLLPQNLTMPHSQNDGALLAASSWYYFLLSSHQEQVEATKSSFGFQLSSSLLMPSFLAIQACSFQMRLVKSFSFGSHGKDLSTK